MKSIACLFAAVIINLTAGFTLAADTDSLKEGFMGLPWGAGADALEEKTAQLQEGNPDIKFFSKYKLALGGTALDEIVFIFHKDKFSGALIFHKNIDELFNALKTALGAPHISSPQSSRWQASLPPDGAETVFAAVLPRQAMGSVINTLYFKALLEEEDGREEGP
jgi:hypothetical protein